MNENLDMSSETLREIIIKEVCKISPDYKKISKAIGDYESNFLPFNDILDCACQATGASRKALIMGFSNREVVDARDLVTRYLFEQRGLRKSLIAKKLGRHHTTVLASLKKTGYWEKINDKVWMNLKGTFEEILWEKSIEQEHNEK